jgi:hypothetical protein
MAMITIMRTQMPDINLWLRTTIRPGMDTRRVMTMPTDTTMPTGTTKHTDMTKRTDMATTMGMATHMAYPPMASIYAWELRWA